MRQDAPAAETIPVVDQLRELVFAEGDVVATEFGPDGLYVMLAKPSLNVGLLISEYAPHVCAAMLGLAMLWLMLRTIGVMRRRYRRGMPHCARCGYELGSLGSRDDRSRWSFAPEFRCPECGTPAARRRPIIGRSPLRRVRAPLIATVILATISLWLWWPVWRGPGARLLPFDINSTRLRGVFDHLVPKGASERVWFDVASVVQIKDLADPVPTVVLKKGPGIIYFSFFVSPHDGSLFIPDTIRGRLRRYDGKTGRLLGVIDVPWSPRYLEPMNVIGVSDGGSLGYIEWDKQIVQRGGVLEWDFATNKTRVLVDLPYIRDSRPSMTNVDRRSFVRIPGREPAVFLSYSDSLGRDAPHFELHPRDALSASEPLLIEKMQHPAIGRVYDPRRAWVSPSRHLYAMGVESVISVIGIESGRVEREVAGIPESLRLNADFPFWVRRDERMAACAMPDKSNMIGVYRLIDGKQVAALSSPTTLYLTHIRISPDGEFVVANTYNQATDQSSNFASQSIIIWRLPDEVLQSIDGGG